MNNTGFIAKRYLFSRKHISLISTLTYISISGVTIGTALLIVVLSVFNGFFDVIKGLLLSYDPDIRIESATTSDFIPEKDLFSQINEWPEVTLYSPYVEGKALITYEDRGNKVIDVKGIEPDNYYNTVTMDESVT